MKIAILGTAPSSMMLAPFGDPAFKIWACSPGTYPYIPRCDAFFELHRPEFGEVGKPATQKPWFSPEYVQWLGLQRCNVWMQQPVPQVPQSRALPVDELLSRYGSYFFTSTIAWMLACAIEDVLQDRNAVKESASKEFDAGQRNFCSPEPDVIALYGVDMAANEEYGYQRAGCQHFMLLAADLGIKIVVPPESDLLRPMPLYGIDEGSHWMIKATARKRELEARLAQVTAAAANATGEMHFVRGALDDLDYHMKTWGDGREGMGTSAEIMAQSPALRAQILDSAGQDGDLAEVRRMASAGAPLVVVDG